MIPKITPDESITNRILDKGCYSHEENKRIYNKWFAKGPRHQFQAVNRKYRLTDKVICDIGCGYGMNLLYCQPGSYGIEIDDYPIKFAHSIGLSVHKRDFMHDDIEDLKKVDAVWSSAIMEHVESVHVFLRKIHNLLKPGGLAVIYVPTVPLIPALRYVPGLERFITGHLYDDHINGFTPSTLRFFCEFAGFETIEVGPFYPPPLSVFNRVPLLNCLVDGATYVGRKIDNWEYPPNATRVATQSGQGFRYKDSFYDGNLRA